MTRLLRCDSGGTNLLKGSKSGFVEYLPLFVLISESTSWSVISMQDDDDSYKLCFCGRILRH